VRVFLDRGQRWGREREGCEAWPGGGLREEGGRWAEGRQREKEKRAEKLSHARRRRSGGGGGGSEELMGLSRFMILREGGRGIERERERENARERETERERGREGERT
jgi:hypothetical protein